MTPVDQTLFGEGKGNCFAACIASVLDLSLEDVPNFCAEPGDWCTRFREWLAERGLGCAFLTLGGYSIASCVGNAVVMVGGKSPRGDFLHQVVYRGDTLIHDPHPDRTGVETLFDVTVLFPLTGAP